MGLELRDSVGRSQSLERWKLLVLVLSWDLLQITPHAGGERFVIVFGSRDFLQGLQ